MPSGKLLTMKRILELSLFSILVFLIQSCTTPKYFYDSSSHERQKELRSCRSDNVFCDIMSGIGSVFMGAILDTEIEFYPDDQQFKKLHLRNPTSDTIYVNMLSDVIWDKEDYCDFMDIRIPAHLTCKVMVPLETTYNLYFSNTPQNDDDEMIEIFTTDVKKISLYPGLTAIKDTIQKF